MKMQESFSKPDAETPEDTIQNLPALPRSLQPATVNFSIAWRILSFAVLSALSGYIIFQAYCDYIQTASFISWFVLIAVLPIWLGFVPWYLITTFKQRMASFAYCREIYQNGVPAIGTISVLTWNSTHCPYFHFFEKKRFQSRSKIRIDFTFPMGDSLGSGTACIREQNIGNLQFDSKVCVLYLPDDPAQNIIFPIPSSEFFTYLQR